MALKDLHILPRVEDSWSFLYAQKCKVEQEGKAISIWDDGGRVAVPSASLSLLMLGPGSTITHAAVRNLAETGCMIEWCGEEGVRVYGVGMGETRSSRQILRQAAAWANPTLRLEVVRRMYAQRFREPVDETWSLQQMRGREGIRVRGAYQEASRATGVEWKGREYKRDDWKSASPVNRALSCANSCLYGLCHAAIVAAGYSPAIGFIHTGKALSFVYDIADLYKLDTTIPAAFAAARDVTAELEGVVRRGMREMFHESRLLERILPDLANLFEGLSTEVDASLVPLLDADEALPAGLWDPVAGQVAGGVSYAEESNGCDDAGTGSGQPAG